MTAALTERHKSDPDAHIRSTFAIVCALRKEYDAQRAKVVEKQALLHRLQREVQVSKGPKTQPVLSTDFVYR
jgi:hypothetical protein